MTLPTIHSTGRGGAGNIGPSDGTYTDGEVVREGYAGTASSSGRGGAGNIQPPAAGSSDTSPPKSSDIIPESATRTAGQPGYENFHTGRAGAGNVYKEKYGGHSTVGEMKKGEKVDGKENKEGGLVEKVKHAIGLDKKREKTPEVN